MRQLRNQRKTEEGDPQDDDSYLGYSVATGEFNGDGDGMDVAVGMPRGANLTGKVGFIFLNLPIQGPRGWVGATWILLYYIRNSDNLQD